MGLHPTRSGTSLSRGSHVWSRWTTTTSARRFPPCRCPPSGLIAWLLSNFARVSVVSRQRRFPWMIGRTVTIFLGMTHFDTEISNVKLPCFLALCHLGTQAFVGWDWLLQGLSRLGRSASQLAPSFAFLPASSISPPVFFSLTWRKTEQGWKTSAAPVYANLIRDVRNRRPDNEVLHIQTHTLWSCDVAVSHTSDLVDSLPNRIVMASNLASRCSSEAYKNAELWKKPQYGGAQSMSSAETAASSTATSSTSGQSLSAGRPAPSAAPVLSTVAEEEPIEPEDTHPTPAMQQRSGVPLQQAYPYVTHRLDSDGEDDMGSASPTFSNTLVQHVCRNMNDTQAHEAVINKTWFQKLAEHDTQCRRQKMVSAPEAQRLPQQLQSARSLSRTVPSWISNKMQGEAAFGPRGRTMVPVKRVHLSAPRPLKRSSSILCMRWLHLPWSASKPSCLKNRRNQRKLHEVLSRCHGTCVLPTVSRLHLLSLVPARLNLPAWKPSARRMMRSLHVSWQTVRPMRKIGMTIGSDPVFVSSGLHNFASHVLEGSSLRLAHAKGCSLEFAYELSRL